MTSAAISAGAIQPTMKANVGDWLVIKGTTTERSDQRGLITEVHFADGSLYEEAPHAEPPARSSILHGASDGSLSEV